MRVQIDQPPRARDSLPAARLCRARLPRPRNTRSAASENRCPASEKDVRTWLHRIYRTGLRQTRRTAPPPAAHLAADRTDAQAPMPTPCALSTNPLASPDPCALPIAMSAFYE